MQERLFVSPPSDDGTSAPETSVPRSTLGSLAVGPALVPWVSSILSYRETFPPGTEATERVLPDGATRLIVHLEGARPRALVVGASTAAAVLTMRGEQHGLSITLRPGAVGALFGGLEASELAHQTLPLEVLWPEERDLADLLQRDRDDHARARRLAAALGARLGTPPAGHLTAARAVALIHQAGGQRSVRSIAAEIGVGERRLQQLLAMHVGLAPRQLARLGRMRTCLRLLRAPPRRGWAAVAADAGFYDQAHLGNELRALSGLTPTDLLALVSGSSKPPPHGPR